MRRSSYVALLPQSLRLFHHIINCTFLQQAAKKIFWKGILSPFYLIMELIFVPFFFQRRLYLMMKYSISIANVHWSVPLRLVFTLPHWLKTAVFFFFSPSLQPLILFEGFLKMLAVLIVAFAAACCVMLLLQGLKHCLVFFLYPLYYYRPTRWIVIRLFFP